MTIVPAYLSLGSNIEPQKHLGEAIKKIKVDFINPVISSVYQTAAQGFAGDDFLNLAIQISTELNLAELLNYTESLEQAAGRVRVKRGNFDARTLDVDVVVYGDLVGLHEGKIWPAEDLKDYGHVLKPLAEIAEQAKDPLSGHTFKQLWDQFENKHEFERSTKIIDTQQLFS